MLELDHKFLGNLYSTPGNEAQWIPVLDELCSRLSARSAVVQLLVKRPAGGLLHVWTGRDTRSLAEADLHDRCLNNPLNPRLAPPPRPPRDGQQHEIGSDLRMFQDDQRELARLHDHLAQVGLGHAVWAGFQISEDRHFALILHRNPGDSRDLEPGEETFLRELLPHLKQGVRLASTIAASQTKIQAIEAAVDQVRTGVLICDSELNLHWHNRSAGQIIARSPHLHVVRNRLMGSQIAGHNKLRRLVQAAPYGTAIALGNGGSAPLHLRATELTRETAAEMWFPGCIGLFLSETDTAPALDPGELAALFGLTPAEARLASALVAGASLNDYAADRGIAIGTARVQMKQVLAKTDSGRQSELVRQLCGSVAASTLRNFP